MPAPATTNLNHPLPLRAYLTLSGLISLTLGLAWSPFFPLNKNLWTSSYVLFSAGLSLLLLALCYWLIDVRGLNDSPAGKALLWPWLVFGSNAITAFVLSNLFVQTASWIKVPAGAWVYPANPAKYISAWQWAYIHLFARHGSTYITSLPFATRVRCYLLHSKLDTVAQRDFSQDLARKSHVKPSSGLTLSIQKQWGVARTTVQTDKMVIRGNSVILRRETKGCEWTERLIPYRGGSDPDQTVFRSGSNLFLMEYFRIIW